MLRLSRLLCQVLISLERRNDDGVPQFLQRLEEAFVVERSWASFDPSELTAILQRSHIGVERKPLEIYSAVRRS